MLRFLSALALAAAMGLIAPASAQNWQPLGQATIGARVQTDVIEVGRQEGRFRSIRLEVKGNDVEIIDLKIIYGNGAPDDIQVRRVFRAGSTSAPLPVKGTDRAIRQIVVTYRAIGPVAIQFFGDAAPPKEQWVEFGCKRVNFLIDKDVIPVGRREGRFTAVRLRSKGNRVQVLDLRVIYANGAPDSIPVRFVIPSGGETKPLPLKGDGRAIGQVEVVYVAQPTFKGQGTLCVDGRQQ